MPVESLLFENAAGSLFASDGDFLRSCWGSEARTLADTQAFLGRLAQLLRQHRLQKMLINQVAMPPFSAEEQTWINHEWLPRTVREAGYRCGALVVAADLYARLAMANIITNPLGLPLRYRSFDDEAQAAEWLQQQ